MFYMQSLEIYIVFATGLISHMLECLSHCYSRALYLLVSIQLRNYGVKC
jgi:hypothetical protein